MSTKEFQVRTPDGLKLCCRTWLVPDGTPVKGRALFLHGFGEFLDAFNEWFPLVSEAGYEVTAYDQRGHGNTALSPEDFGKSNEALLMNDIETMVSFMLEESENGQTPFILWGFSMGGANCLNYMAKGQQRNQIDLYISVGPYLETHPDINKGLNALKLWVMPYLAKVYPSYTDVADLRPEMSTNNPEKWKLYKKQPLRHSRATVEFMNDAVNRGRNLRKKSYIADLAERPLLLCHGTGDQICDVRATEEFFNLAELDDKTLDLYPGLPHELMQCVDKDRLEHWRRVCEWLDNHVAHSPNAI